MSHPMVGKHASSPSADDPSSPKRTRTAAASQVSASGDGSGSKPHIPDAALVDKLEAKFETIVSDNAKEFADIQARALDERMSGLKQALHTFRADLYDLFMSRSHDMPGDTGLLALVESLLTERKHTSDIKYRYSERASKVRAVAQCQEGVDRYLRTAPEELKGEVQQLEAVCEQARADVGRNVEQAKVDAKRAADLAALDKQKAFRGELDRLGFPSGESASEAISTEEAEKALARNKVEGVARASKDRFATGYGAEPDMIFTSQLYDLVVESLQVWGWETYDKEYRELAKAMSDKLAAERKRQEEQQKQEEEAGRGVKHPKRQLHQALTVWKSNQIKDDVEGIVSKLKKEEALVRKYDMIVGSLADRMTKA